MKIELFLSEFNTFRTTDDTIDTTLIVLIAMGIIFLFLISIAAIYGIAALRRRNIVLKKVDYLIEDITYKSESLNVTVETLNKVSNYLLTLDAVSQNGLKMFIKLISENRNYIYSILDRMRVDVERKEKERREKEKEEKKSTKKDKISESSSTKKNDKKSQKDSVKIVDEKNSSIKQKDDKK